MTPKIEIAESRDDREPVVDGDSGPCDEEKEERGGITDVNIFTKNIALRARRNGIIVRVFLFVIYGLLKRIVHNSYSKPQQFLTVFLQ